MKYRMFRTARAAAIASLAATQGPLAARVMGGAGDPGREAFAAFIEKAWQEAWGTPFVLNASGLLLEERGPGIFAVRVSDGERIVAEGTWFEVLRLEARLPVDLSGHEGGAELLRIEQAAAAGVLVGSTGSIRPAFGIAVTLESGEPGGPAPVQAFTPLGFARDMQAALDGARDLQAWLNAAEPVLAGGDPPPNTPDSCRCQEKHALALEACKWRGIACVSACIGTAVVAAAACGALGPLGPICMAGVLAAYAACCGACLANEQACRTEAAAALIDCELACQPQNGPSHGSPGR